MNALLPQLPPRAAGLLLALLQGGLLLSLGGVMLGERARLPRAWVPTAPYDPELPIRGRYVSLQLLVPAPQLGAALPAATGTNRGLTPSPWQAVRLVARRERLEALRPLPGQPPTGQHQARIERDGGAVVARLIQPVAFFIPPGVDDPSRRPSGERLWVEVTLPAEGPPRPIRLGLAPAEGGAITPLPLR